MNLTQHDRNILRAVMGVAAMEFTRRAQHADETSRKEPAAKWTAMASECVRHAENFGGDKWILLSGGDGMVIGAALEFVAGEYRIRAAESARKHDRIQAHNMAAFASECERLAVLFPKGR